MCMASLIKVLSLLFVNLEFRVSRFIIPKYLFKIQLRNNKRSMLELQKLFLIMIRMLIRSQHVLNVMEFCIDTALKSIEIGI